MGQIVDFLISLYHYIDSSPVGWVWIIALFLCLGNNKLSGAQKFVWFILICWLHIFGALLYLFLVPGGWYQQIARKMQKKQKASQTQKWAQNVPSPAQPQAQQSLYQAGYQAQTTASAGFYSSVGVAPASQQAVHRVHDILPPASPEEEPEYYDPQYEQPQIIYPKMTQDADN